MAFNESIASRIRAQLDRQKGITEQKMFGGLAFLLHGNMCCGVTKDRLMLRLGPEGAAEAATLPHARPMDFTGKPMKSMIFVDPEGFATEADLKAWIDRAVGFVLTLPAKAR